MYSRLLIGSSIILLAVAQVVMGQEDFYTQPQIAANGDYLTNAGYVMGKVAGGQLQAGALWRVVIPGLNCRQNSETNAVIVRSLKQGAIIQADLGRGGSDEVLYNAKDRQGRTWMRVRSQNGQSYNCYVRANKRFIQPVTTPH
jgi:hypothetical protein